MNTKGTVSIIMRTKNCDWVIAQTLAALYSQHYTDFELLVVDSGSTDRTLEIVCHYPARIVAIAPDDYVPGQVLNDAIARTSSNRIVLLNADTVLLTPQSLGNLIHALDDPMVQAAFGRQVPRPEAETWVRRDYRVAFPSAGEAPAWLPLSLPIAIMRRSAWLQHPFYTDAWGSEDTEWGLWARRAGFRIAYVPETVAMHSHNYTLRQLYGRRFIEGEADAFLYQREPHRGSTTLSALTALCRELREHVRVRDLAGLLHAPLRVLAAQRGYFAGLRHGSKRRLTGDHDLRTGQQTVLQRHESVRQKATTRP